MKYTQHIDEDEHAKNMYCCVRIGVIAIVMQTLIMFTALISGGFMYPYLLHTSKNVDSLVTDVRSEYAILDKKAIHDIVKHSQNASYTTRQLLQHHGNAIVVDAHKISSAAVQHTNLLDTIDRIVHLVETPVQEIHDVVTHEHSVNFQKSLHVADHLLSKLNILEFNRIANTTIQFLDKFNDELNPETMKEI